MDEVLEIEPQIKQRKKLSEESLNKLKKAREMAIEKKKLLKSTNEELNNIKKKENLTKKITDNDAEIEVYKNVKNRVEQELKTNELSYLKNNMENMINKFNNIETNLNSYIQERREKKEVKNKRQLVNELPNNISKNILNDELKRIELSKFRKEVFGL